MLAVLLKMNEPDPLLLMPSKSMPPARITHGWERVRELKSKWVFPVLKTVAALNGGFAAVGM